ncbi:hypothetical protein [Persicitalea sp.]|uniref:hypothetical protein n=1 Tax=Persicitalea sp. TaxID=3100273 RepID=UPI00359313A1
MEQQLPLEKELRDLFAKFPAFPESLVDILVTLAPWLTLLGAILGIIGLLSLLGLGAAFVGAIGVNAYGSSWKFYLGIIGGAIAAVLYLMAFSPLRANKKKGWDLLYYAFLLNMIIALLQFNILGLIIGFLIGGWILFQIRPKYV